MNTSEVWWGGGGPFCQGQFCWKQRTHTGEILRKPARWEQLSPYPLGESLQTRSQVEPRDDPSFGPTLGMRSLGWHIGTWGGFLSTLQWEFREVRSRTRSKMGTERSSCGTRAKEGGGANLCFGSSRVTVEIRKPRESSQMPVTWSHVGESIQFSQW